MITIKGYAVAAMAHLCGLRYTGVTSMRKLEYAMQSILNNLMARTVSR
jgi:hypothetical protein